MSTSPLPAEEGGRGTCGACYGDGCDACATDVSDAEIERVVKLWYSNEWKGPGDLIDEKGRIQDRVRARRIIKALRGESLPASVVSSEEGGRAERCDCGGELKSIAFGGEVAGTQCTECGAATPNTLRGASVVGDASEGEARDEDETRTTELMAHYGCSREELEAIRRLEWVCGDGQGENDMAMAIVWGALTEARTSLRSTRAALEEARKDAERLNWIDAQEGDVFADLAQQGAGQVSTHEIRIEWQQWARNPAASIREVIDTARRGRRAIPSQESTKV